MTTEERAAIQAKIDGLPSGGISNKTINCKTYAYYQWMENGRQRSRRVQDDELQSLSEALAERKRLIALLREDGADTPETVQLQHQVSCRLGTALRRYAVPVKKYKKRDCYSSLEQFVYGEQTDRVLILYGLRRTGKTTMIRQLVSEMPDEMLSQTVFIQINASNTLAQVNRDLEQFEKNGYRYVFIDEVTLMEDFIEGAALFSDIFASSGMKIVLSGTDSLGFLFAEDEELYDRCILLHTTLIPYREFDRVLGIHGIDEYIRYGGTMSMGGVQYNLQPTFGTKQSTDDYVDTAIARNIQHSLKFYRDGGHFRHLYSLYEKNELTSAINRIIEDMNHRFTIEVLTRPFKSHDLRISASNLRADRESPTDILDRVDVAAITARLKEILEIRNKEKQSIPIQEEHRYEIKEYLDLLDLTVDIPVVHTSDYNQSDSKTVITQPGLRYAQAKALIEQLLQDETFRALSLEERNSVTERILNEIRGRMMEDIVLLETQKAKPGAKVFQLQFPIGEFDMVVFYPDTASCEIYEIKDSKERVPEQYRHLADDTKCKDTAFRFGPITGKYVLYRGDFGDEGDIRYLNVEEYLKEL